MSRVISHFNIGITVQPDVSEEFAKEIVMLENSKSVLGMMSSNTSKTRDSFERSDVDESLVKVIECEYHDD